VGGQQRSLTPMKDLITKDWYDYQKGLILRLDTSTGHCSTELEYISPPDVRPEGEPPILFKSGSLEDGRLYLCTQTEVLVYEVPSLRRLTYISLPQFNDVHHVRPTHDGNLVIANTGLDMVLKVSPTGDILEEWDTLQGRPWTRFSRDVDYRKVLTTKPHLSHPNHVFELDRRVWATRFEQRDAICLEDPDRRIQVGLERIHDGLVVGDSVYFTTVDGKVVIVRKSDLSLVRIIDLQKLEGLDTLLGWCRGLLVDGPLLWIGFTRMRPTRFRENVAWVKNSFKHYLGTHVMCYDMEAGRCVGQYVVEDAGLNAIFGIYQAPDPAR
jgi:hypothetical protein